MARADAKARPAYLTLPAVMPVTIQRLSKNTITAGMATATMAAALMMV
jgi:hypothetical protein